MSANNCGEFQVFDLVDYEALAADNSPAPHVEDLHRCLELVLSEAEAVQVLGPFGHHLLAFDGLADRCHPVPNPCCQLELEVCSGLAHLDAQLVDHG